MKLPLRFFLISIFFLQGAVVVQAQEKEKVQQKRHVLQFSGQVVDNGTREPLSGVHIFIPKTGRGTTSNYYGFYTMPLLAGDSVVVSVVGYHRKTYKIPENYKEDITFVMSMEYDTLYLPDLEIKPYPTEEEFKLAILALELPTQENLKFTMGNANDYLVRQGPYALGYDDPNSNFARYNQQEFDKMQNSNMVPTSNFLNPFAWIKFLKDQKRKKNNRE